MVADAAEVGSAIGVVPLPDQGVVLVAADSIEIRPVRWAWPGFIAQGKLQLLAGPVGTGKTAIALELASTISRGGAWPDGTQARRANVVIYAGEDDLNDTIAPRLRAAGADLGRILLVAGFQDKHERRRFDPGRDASALRAKLRTIDDVALVVIDPVISLVKGSSNDGLDVRRSLEVLLQIADETGAAILGLTHFNKGIGQQDLIDRVIGSQAFSALARIVLIAVKIGDGDERLLARAKSNIGPDDGGILYKMTRQDEVATVSWIGPVEGDARDLMRPPQDDPPSRVQDAEAWLIHVLQGGDMASDEVILQGEAAGHAARTLRRAKRNLRIESARVANGWTWSLPASQEGRGGQPCQDGQRGQANASPS